jgi:hypothetical protein
LAPIVLVSLTRICHKTKTVNQEFHPADLARFEAALRRFDEENGRDPNRELVDAVPQPRELVYARWLTDWVLRLQPGASESLRLAARCQHLCRWAISRDSFPLTRPGYLHWREKLKQFHAQKAGEVLRETGYPAEMVERVQRLIRKQDLATDPEAQVLEDALCLVFLERQFAALAARTSEDKVVNALQKAWRKMSPAARDLASGLAYAPRQQALLARALRDA